MSKIAPYKALASYYDSYAGKERYKNWKSLISEVIENYQVEKGLAIDLACGTGTNTKSLKDLGFNSVIGTDKSKAMLEVAKKKYPHLTFLQKSFLSFFGPKFKDASLITCFYDSLNYLLSEEELKKTLVNVYSALKPKGIFIFDLNTKAHLEGVKNSPKTTFKGKGFEIDMRHSVQDEYWILNLRIKEKQEGELKTVATEQHIEKMYEKKEVLKMLKKAGFKVLETKDHENRYEDGKKYLNRITYIAKRNK